MSPDKQRIAIASVLGWTDFETLMGQFDELRWHVYTNEPNGYPDDSYKAGDLIGKHSPKAPLWSHVPDYPNDLNAMHEVEKVLTSIQYWTFVEWVRVTVQDKHVDYVAHPTSATAAQRAEAFLRTIGKWDDSK